MVTLTVTVKISTSQSLREATGHEPRTLQWQSQLSTDAFFYLSNTAIHKTDFPALDKPALHLIWQILFVAWNLSASLQKPILANNFQRMRHIYRILLLISLHEKVMGSHITLDSWHHMRFAFSKRNLNLSRDLVGYLKSELKIYIIETHHELPPPPPPCLISNSLESTAWRPSPYPVVIWTSGCKYISRPTFGRPRCKYT